MIDTSYVALEHPYRVIEYGGTVGLQIGVLVVTRETEGPDGGYGIETHSHPVVSYVNAGATDASGRRLSAAASSQTPVEGVVWDKVEVGRVTELGREGELMEWQTLMDLSRRTWGLKAPGDRTMGLYCLGQLWTTLQGLGLTLGHPEVRTDDTLGGVKFRSRGMKPRSLSLRVELVVARDGREQYCVAVSGLGLMVPLGDDVEMGQQLEMQVSVYEKLLRLFEVCDVVDLYFFSQQHALDSVVNRLNALMKRRKYIVEVKGEKVRNGLYWWVEKKAASAIEDEDESEIMVVKHEE